MKTIYVSGPISGAGPEWAAPFDAAQRYFEDHGWQVVNPARIDPADLAYDGDGMPALHTLRVFLQRDFQYLTHCDAIALIPGWIASRGANAELAVALMMGLDVYYFVGPPMAEHRLGYAKPSKELLEKVMGTELR